MTKQNNERLKTLENLRGLIDAMPVAMVTTLGADGKLRSRPMAPARHEFDGDLWFFALETSPLVSEVGNHPAVNVTYTDPAKRHFVSASGTAEKAVDQQKMELLWKDELRDWFAEGLATPALVLLRISVEEAEFWEEQATGARGFLGAMIWRKGSFRGVHERIDWREPLAVDLPPDDADEARRNEVESMVSARG